MPAAFPLIPADFDLLCDVIQSVARGGRLPPEEADDFSQTAHLKLLQRNYAPVTLFAGRSSLRTYLTVVARRLLLDWRNARYGKWRPSTSARRLGPAAVDLDRLISRDGRSVDEAVAVLENRLQAPCAESLRALARQLPRRGRVQTVPLDDVQPLCAYGFEDPIDAGQTSAAQRRELVKLRDAYQRLAPDDRRLLRFRFNDDLSIAAIAALLGVPAKPLYRRMERVLQSLASELTGDRPPACGRAAVKRVGKMRDIRRTDPPRMH
jgi:RNA polymerase sigma factor (sigma-70 family)